MYPTETENKYEISLKFLEKTYAKILNNMDFIDVFLDSNENFSKNDVLLIENFLTCLDIIRTKLKHSISMLKRTKLEEYENIIFFP